MKQTEKFKYVTVTKWHLKPCSHLARTDMDRSLGSRPKIGGLCPLFD